MTQLAYLLHVAGGAIGLISGIVAISVRKGGRLHRQAGTVFVASMTLMAVFAMYLAFAIPDQLLNAFISVFSLYLILTAWLAVKRQAGAPIGLAEKSAMVVGVILFAPFAILSFQLATGLPPLFKSAMPFRGPLLVVIYVFTGVLAIAALGDIRLVFAGRIAGVERISRHLWRMCLGLTLALGSGFTNGLARLLPGPFHVPPAFFLPQFVPLLLIAYWLVRLRIRSAGPVVETLAPADR